MGVLRDTGAVGQRVIAFLGLPSGLGRRPQQSWWLAGWPPGRLGACLLRGRPHAAAALCSSLPRLLPSVMSGYQWWEGGREGGILPHPLGA